MKIQFLETEAICFAIIGLETFDKISGRVQRTKGSESLTQKTVRGIPHTPYVYRK